MATVHNYNPSPGYDVLLSGVLGFVNDFETLEKLLCAHPDINEILVNLYPLDSHPAISFNGPYPDVAVHGSTSIDFFLRHNRRAQLCSRDFKYLYQVTAAMSSSSHLIIEVDASFCERMDAQLAIALSRLPHIRKLCLRGCQSIHAKEARSIIRSLIDTTTAKPLCIDFSETPAIVQDLDELPRLINLAKSAGILLQVE